MPEPGRLHLLTDTALQGRFSHRQLAAYAAEAGADVVQYREKNYRSALHKAELARIAQDLSGSSTRLVINDYLALAVAFGVGVHVGQSDASPAAAVAALAPETLVGATVHNLEELEALAKVTLGYIGVGPVFGTASKNTGLPPLGLAGLASIAAMSPFPVIAIGGVTAANVNEVIAAGAYGVAVLGAFCLADNPRAAAEELRGAVDTALHSRNT